MEQERWVRVKALFHAALSLSPSRRAAFLDRACDDSSIRDEVERLVASPDDSFLEAPPPLLVETSFAKGQTFSHYEIVEELGRGGMGIVYRGLDTELRREVAIKTLLDTAGRDTELERFKREARAASAFNHPNITTVYDIGTEGDVLYLVMELLDGQTLSDLLEGGTLSIDHVFDLAMQITEGLAKAHDSGIVHRDLKPDNLFLTRDGTLKILDFGLAKFVGAAELPAEGILTDAPTTQVGILMGTIHYMSPEQASKKTVDERSDLFSLGVILYELLTGRRPFARESLSDSLAALNSAPAAPIAQHRRDVPGSLAAIVHRLLAKRPDDRYDSARALASELREAGESYEAERRTARGGRQRLRRPIGNLPVRVSSFIGRRDDKAEVGSLLSTSRLTTLTGSGGCGKSRLALEVAHHLEGSFPHGAWWVELASLGDPEFLPHLVAKALGLRQESSAPMSEAVADYLSNRKILLVLDNCEHIIGPCASFAGALLERCPDLVLLATSREALAVPGERVWRVPSLRFPPPGADASEASDADAVRLFLERAGRADAAFRASRPDLVARICRRLDGIPLAIELAATRVHVLSLEEIDHRLNECFELLATSTRAVLPRQQTLRATIDWSYDLLSESEQTLLRRLSVFADGWTLAAAERVCGADPVKRGSVLELLTRLVDKSLVYAGAGGSRGRRFQVLETVRQYAKERLESAGEPVDLRRRHAEYFVSVAVEAEPELVRAGQVTWLEDLQADHGNLRKAFEATQASEELSEKGLELAGRLWWYFVKRGHLAEGRQWLERALAQCPEGLAVARARGLLGLGMLTYFQGQVESGDATLSNSVTVARSAGDPITLAAALLAWGNAAMEMGRLDESHESLKEAMGLGRELGDAWTIGVALHLTGLLKRFGQGDPEGARSILEDAVSTMAGPGDLWLLANSLYELAEIARIQGRVEDARGLSRDGLEYCRQLQDAQVTGWFLDLLGGLAIAEGRATRGARLLSSADCVLSLIGSQRPPTIEEPYLLHRSACRALLAESEVTAVADVGPVRTLKDAFDVASAELD